MPSKPLLLVTGDSGIGKTAVLEAAAALARRETCAPEPLNLAAYDGSLQTTLLEGLCDALLIGERRAPSSSRVANVLQSMGRRFSDATRKEMGRAVLNAATGYLEGKLGTQASESLRKIFDEISTGAEAALRQRLQSSTDRDAMKQIASFANLVHNDVGKVVLYLDRAERLTSNDFAALSELADFLPPGVQVVAAISEFGAHHAARVREARAWGVPTDAIPPLLAEHVSDWLSLEGLPTNLVADVMRHTDGYPLFVQSAIGYLQEGKRLPDLPVAESFRAITEQAWLRLSTEARACATVLAGLEDAPDENERAAILHLQPHTWAAIREELVDSRLFIAGKVSGAEPWFHDRRRHIIWSDILSEIDRRATADRVTAGLRDLIERDGLRGPGTVRNLALLAPLSSSLDGIVMVQEVLLLSTGALAVLASIEELLEPKDRDPDFVDIQLVMAHCLDNFPEIKDPISALEELVTTSLVYFASERDVGIITVTFPSQLVAALVYGRSLVEFGKAPVHRAASTAFNLVLRDLVVPFSQCIYGNGKPNVGDSYRELSSLLAVTRPPVVHWQGSFGSRSLHLTSAHDSIENRDHAAERLTTAQATLLQEPLRTEFVISLPVRPIPTSRFLTAYQLLTRHDISLHMMTAPKTAEILEPQRLAEARVAISEAVSQGFSHNERIAAGMSGHCFVAWSEGEDGSYTLATMDAERSGIVRLDNDQVSAFGDPFAAMRMAQSAGLSAASFVRNVHWSAGRHTTSDPSAEFLIEIAKSIDTFNHANIEWLLPRDADQLQTALSQSIARMYEDAEFLLKSGVLVDRPTPIIPCKYFFLVHTQGRDDWWSRSSLHYDFKVVESDDVGVSLVVLDELPPSSDGATFDGGKLERVFGGESQKDGRRGRSTSGDPIANFLGFHSSARHGVRISGHGLESE